MRVLVRVEHKFHPLLNSCNRVVVGELMLLKECFQVDSHNDVYKMNLIIVCYMLIFFYLVNNLLEEVLIRVNYLLPRFIRPWFLPVDLLEQYLSLLKCQLLLTSDPLLFKSLLLLYLSLLFLRCDRMARLAPFVPNLSLEFNGPGVACCTSYQNLGSALELLESAFTVLLRACLLDGVENFDTVVADSIFLGQLPEVMSASRAWRLLGLLLSNLDIPLASNLRECFVGISGGHQIFKEFNFWVFRCHFFSKVSGVDVNECTRSVEEVFNNVGLEYEFLLDPARGLCEMGVHFGESFVKKVKIRL